MSKVDVIKITDNVYRTKDYIVKQNLFVVVNLENNNSILSIDTYFRRTLLRDAEYLLLYKDRKNIDGKRLPSNTYIRTYID